MNKKKIISLITVVTLAMTLINPLQSVSAKEKGGIKLNKKNIETIAEKLKENDQEISNELKSKVNGEKISSIVVEDRRKNKGSGNSDFFNNNVKTKSIAKEMNNMVVYSRFKGEEEFLDDDFHDNTIEDTFDTMYNTGSISMRDYYNKVSLSKLDVPTRFLGQNSSKLVSIELEHERSYYEPYSSKNKNGYLNDIVFDENGKMVGWSYPCDGKDCDLDISDGIVCEHYVEDHIGYEIMSTDLDSLWRETNLLYEISEKVNEEAAKKYNFDINSDNIIDSVVFLLNGDLSTGKCNSDWSDLLWPHKCSLKDIRESIKGDYRDIAEMLGFNYDFIDKECAISNKYVDTYNLYTIDALLEKRCLFEANDKTLGNVGTISHEFAHSLGLPDLYSYNDQTAYPMGTWDLMDSTGVIPQYTNSVFRNKLGWVTDNQLQSITEDGEYQLQPVTTVGANGTVAYTITLPEDPKQKFVIEYRKAEEIYDGYNIIYDESNTLYDGSGIIIYRVDTNYGDELRGNMDAPPYTFYTFRPKSVTYYGEEYTDMGSRVLLSSLNDSRSVFGNIDGNNTNNAITFQNSNGSEKNTRIVVNNVKTDGISNTIKFNVDAKDPSIKDVQANKIEDKITVEFDEKIKSVDDFASIKLFDENNNSKAINCSIDGKKLIITAKDGKFDTKYTLKIPKTSIVDLVGKTLLSDLSKNIDLTAEEEVVAVEGITLDKESIEVEEGNTTELKATVKPENATNKNVTWSSSDNAIATVENGVVKAIGEGEATITATTVDGGFKAECKVTVTKKEEVTVPVTSVVLDKEEIEAEVNDEITLKATVNPEDATNKQLIWTSSNNDVATVNNGVVKAIGEGEATITVTTEDGGYTATCKVTVKKKVIAVTSVTLDNTEIEGKEGDTITLTATVNPEDATNKNVQWITSDSEVATVENGEVKLLSEGEAIITVKTEDGGYTATCKVVVNKKDEPTTPPVVDDTDTDDDNDDNSNTPSGNTGGNTTTTEGKKTETKNHNNKTTTATNKKKLPKTGTVPYMEIGAIITALGVVILKKNK